MAQKQRRPPGGYQGAAVVSDLGKISAAQDSRSSEPAQLSPADTRLNSAYTRRFGCPELHCVHFQHKADRGGFCDAVGVQVPETPPDLIERGLAVARAERARVSFLCDTFEQARAMYDLARRRLPDHRHVAMARAEAGAWGLLA